MDYYSIISKGYEKLHLEEQSKKLDIIRENLAINKATRLLDIGCGTGISSNFDCYVVGVDRSIGMLKRNPNRAKICGIAELLPFKNSSFECVISVTSIHNFEDIEKSIMEMRRLSRGKVVITILNKARRFSSINKCIAKQIKIEKITNEGKDTILFCQVPASCRKT